MLTDGLLVFAEKQEVASAGSTPSTGIIDVGVDGMKLTTSRYPFFLNVIVHELKRSAGDETYRLDLIDGVGVSANGNELTSADVDGVSVAPGADGVVLSLDLGTTAVEEGSQGIQRYALLGANTGDGGQNNQKADPWCFQRYMQVRAVTSGTDPNLVYTAFLSPSRLADAPTRNVPLQSGWKTGAAIEANNSLLGAQPTP